MQSGLKNLNYLFKKRDDYSIDFQVKVVKYIAVKCPRRMHVFWKYM